VTARWPLIWLALAGLAREPALYADLSPPKVGITYGYAGADLLVYGAVQQHDGAEPDAPPRIIVIARGPDKPITVRQKARVAGIWVNAASERFLTAPSFVSVATTDPVSDLVDERTAAIWELSLPQLQFSPYGGEDPARTAEFVRGLIDLRRREGLYRERPGSVTVTDNILYRAEIFIPPAAPVGDYAITVLLIREGKVVATAARGLTVEKTGFEARISRFASDQALLYGLATVALAVMAGLLGSLAARRH
jgi:uncharacterized protein (TIGR02186 family)